MQQINTEKVKDLTRLSGHNNLPGTVQENEI